MGLITTSQKRDTPYWLNYLYSGQMFCWSFSGTITGTNSVYYIITTSNGGRLHHYLERLLFFASNLVNIEVYETCTYSTKGVSNNAVNMNRNSTKISDTKFWTGGSGYGYSAGNMIDQLVINPVEYGFTYIGSGNMVTGLTEKIYKPNTDYLVRINNGVSANTTFSITEYFYESGN